MKMLQAQGNNDHQWFTLYGRKERQQEPKEFSIRFPGGHICVSRCSNGTFWAHISVYNSPDAHPDTDGHERGTFSEGRIDCLGMHAAETDLGSLSRNDCNHVGVRISRV